MHATQKLISAALAATLCVTCAPVAALEACAQPLQATASQSTQTGTITPDLIVPAATAEDESGTISPDLIVPENAAGTHDIAVTASNAESVTSALAADGAAAASDGETGTITPDLIVPLEDAEASDTFDNTQTTCGNALQQALASVYMSALHPQTRTLSTSKTTYATGRLTMSATHTFDGGGTLVATRDVQADGTVTVSVTAQDAQREVALEATSAGVFAQATSAAGVAVEAAAGADGAGAGATVTVDVLAAAVEGAAAGAAGAASAATATSTTAASAAAGALGVPLAVRASDTFANAPEITVNVAGTDAVTLTFPLMAATFCAPFGINFDALAPTSTAAAGVVAVDAQTGQLLTCAQAAPTGLTLTLPAGTHALKLVNAAAAFADVDAAAWYAPAAAFVSARGIIQGTDAAQNAEGVTGTSSTAATFDPNGEVTRGMMVQILYNAARAQGQVSAAEAAAFAQASDTFADTAGTYYAAAANWAAAVGVTTGVGGGRFDGNATITREQAACMLWRWRGARRVGVAAARRFADYEAVSRWAREGVSWAVGAGLISGVNGQIAPTTTLTRAQIATMLERLLG